MKIKPQKIDQEMERAIIMLTGCVSKRCRNPKPIILHSIRVGLKLLELRQPKEVVLAGILHDLVEDTNCTIEQIKKAFGAKVAKLVIATTQEKVGDYKKRWHILMEKIKKEGEQAMMLKLVDMNENLTYLPLVKNHKELEVIRWKHNFAMSQLKQHLGYLKIFQECQNSYKEAFRKLGVK